MLPVILFSSRVQFPGIAAEILSPGTRGRFLYRRGNIKKFTCASILPPPGTFLPLCPFSVSPFWTSSCLFLQRALFSVRKTRGRKFPEAVTGGGRRGIILGRNRRAGNQRNDARKEREKKDRSIRNRERTGNLISRIAFALNRARPLLFLSSIADVSPPSPSPSSASIAASRRKRRKKMTKIRFPSSCLPALLFFNELHRLTVFHSPLATLTLEYICIYMCVCVRGRVQSRKQFIDFSLCGFQE